MLPAPPQGNSLRSVDPDDVQVAIVDTLLVLVGEARAAPGAVVHKAPLCLLSRPTRPLLLPRTSRTCPSARVSHSLFTVPLRSGCRGWLVCTGSARAPRLKARSETCRRQIEGLLSCRYRGWLHFFWSPSYTKGSEKFAKLCARFLKSLQVSAYFMKNMQAIFTLQNLQVICTG